VSAGGDEQLGGGNRTDAFGRQQRQVGGGDQLTELVVEFAVLAGQELVPLGEHLQSPQHSMRHTGLGMWPAPGQGVDQCLVPHGPVLLPHLDRGGDEHGVDLIDRSSAGLGG
jgi:hypothetical protein